MEASSLRQLVVEATRGGETTPFYVLDLDAIECRYLAMREAWRQVFNQPVEIAYSYKTNSLGELTRHLRSLGSGAEVVCAAELEWALADGHLGENIYFNGPGKTFAEIERACAVNARLQLDSLDELSSVIAVTETREVGNPRLSARLALPNSQFGVSRFGLLADEFRTLHGELRTRGLALDGIHVHAGNKCGTPHSFAAMVATVSPFLRFLQHNEHRVVLDIGGGFPSKRSLMGVIPALDTDFAEAVHTSLVTDGVDLDRLSIVLEPGRSLTDDFGILVLRVVARKRRGDAHLLIVDGGGNLAGMGGVPASAVVLDASGPAMTRYQVLGSNCFEQDVIASNVPGPAEVAHGTCILVHGIGGYALNTAPAWTRPLPGVLILQNGRLDVARRPQTPAHLRMRDQGTLPGGDNP